jgi:hypothetical protein
MLIGMLLALLSGCAGEPPSGQLDTTPFITPQERARMSIEERDDPYTRMHTQRPDGNTKPTR